MHPPHHPRPLHRTLLPVALSVLSALLYALAFPPWSLSWLAWFALAPFLVAVTRVGARTAAFCGGLWALVAAYGVGWWFPSMIASYFSVPPAVGWLGFLAVSVLCAGVYVAAFAVWLNWLARRGRVHPLLVALGWGTCELVRARVGIANPWALVGYSQTGFAPLLQLADLAGPYGIGMLVVSVNACVAAVAEPALRPRRAGAAVVMALWVAAYGYGLWRLTCPFGLGKPITVAVAQGAVGRELRRQPGGGAASLERQLDLTRAAAVVRPDLIIWPESAIDFFLQDPSPAADAVREAARKSHADLIVGGAAYTFGDEALRYHNSVFLVRGGLIVGRYDKRRLLPLAEASVLGPFMRTGPAYVSGDAGGALATRAAKVGTFVCSDGLYPEVVRALVTDGSAELLADLSNDSWFGARAPARQHLEMVAMRAVENRRWLVRATLTGYSAAIDPHGRIVARSRFGEPDVLTAAVEQSNARTPYQRWGDLPIAAAAVLVAGLCAIRAQRGGAT